MQPEWEKGRSALKKLTGKATILSVLGTPRRSWKESIRMDIKEIGINTMNWVDSAQDRALLDNPYECDIEPP